MPIMNKLLGITIAALAASAHARTLWSSKPADAGPRSGQEYILKTAYPLGNGRLGATPYGAPGSAGLMLNVDSLWSGGPFEASFRFEGWSLANQNGETSQNYTGGNPLEPKYEALPEIRSTIFTNGSGDMSALLGSGRNYGSYRVLGNLSIALDGADGGFTGYRRELDLNTGVHTTSFTLPSPSSEEGTGRNVSERTFCSFPDQVCVYQLTLSSTPVGAEAALPAVSIRFENILVDQSLIQLTCRDNMVRLTGVTQAGPPEGMKYDSIAQVTDNAHAGQTTSCDETGTLTITPGQDQQSITVVISAGTDYDQTKGNAESGYSFRGADPGPQVEHQASSAAGKPFADLLAAHMADYTRLAGAFELDLPDLDNSAAIETADLISQYSVDGTGDPYLEAALFDYGRYLLISSSRSNSLPANLQGRWAEGIDSEWGADYHANINLQMNYWPAEQTGLTETYEALWSYMRDTWVPRGTETARLLYGAEEGWVVHNEMNVFGHTALKEEAGWANYPVAAAWMMQHVWNNFDYTQDTAWLRDSGYPLIKGVAQFWLSQLQDDAFTGDGTLVANPCNSPEHGGTTFGCAHYQQEITHVFAAALSSAAALGATDDNDDEEFLASVAAKLDKLDKGLHYASWGGLKEWKLPESYGWDVPNTHRHLSHLTGWHPGWAISSFQDGYRDGQVQAAVEQTLVSRGPGNAEDANAGWAKVWRSACWARLNNTERAYWELRYAIDVNFAPNGLSMYKATNQPFQIDANFGLAGAVLSMLVVDLPLPHDTAVNAAAAGLEDARTVVLGPAIPARWGGGSVKGLRIRGGGSVDFSWDQNGLVKDALVMGSKSKVRLVNVEGDVLAEA
ncbi:Six-hairpin glycosidase-like protein [Microdochium trichocladiopsis]|uniref:Six-hairpin glycosidase-like protein n=1 Tax=Microdochium trichocladiopsis TaxID=1682393 RepID=A0A9P8YAF5_9PEZI|nr:Six-hairpin glycosidase-like protein [Microdochium trichocladiopsis]KAH7033636.1 Six-hairpin glycosidase-like protein [Microdochium trichocladiopsis]